MLTLGPELPCVWRGTWRTVEFAIQQTTHLRYEIDYTNNGDIYQPHTEPNSWWYFKHTDEDNDAFNKEWERIYAVVRILNSANCSAYDPAEFCRELLG